MSRSFTTKKSFITVMVSFAATAVLWVVLAATTARADWPNTNATKYYQPPDLTPASYNVLAAQPPAGSGTGLPLILADDFPCTLTGPITDIHIWASWLGDTATANIPDMPITLGFWSDVPASNNVDGQTVPSHPGILLWTQTFQPGGAIPGHYKKVPVSWAPSQFWDPDPFPAGSIMGNDNINWQYNFYPDPAQPNGLFVQQGTATAPTNYWLSVTAGTNVVAFGWRTAAVHYNDDAVFGHMDPVTGTTPLGDWQELSSPQTPTRSLDLAFALTTTNQPPPPSPTPTNKWVQYPDLQSGFGLDVSATSPNVANGLLTLADDFKCTVVGPITNIQFWASFNNDMPPGANTFVVSIWSDAPKGPNGFSQPFIRLWSQTYNPGDYLPPMPAGTGTEHFYDPTTSTPPSSESVVWLYSFDVFPTNTFCQQGQGTVYWVSVASLSPPAAYWQWGWKTSTNHWGDTGVWGKVDPNSANLLVPWQPLFNPLVTAAVPAPVDFAFRINSGPPSPDCDPALGGVIQPPDTSTNGLDVWALTPAMVGDDFLCHVRGYISGFSIWGSWLNDQVDTNALFQVNLWTDVPASPAAGPYSHPGSLVCSSVFSPPQTPGDALRYQSSLFRTNLQENFYYPNPPGTAGLIGNDTQIWRYDFFPFVPSCFEQEGGPFANGKTYWVTVSYLPSPGNATADFFGWKTSTTHFQDAAVFGTNGSTWTPLYDPRSGTQLDLAKVVWKFSVTGINKDVVNNTPTTATGIQIILKGAHLITWYFSAPPWANFSTSFDAAGDTVLQWSGGATVPPGGISHVGFEMPGKGPPPIWGMNWLNGTTIIGTPVQINYHLLGDPTAVELNDFYPGTVIPGTASVEYYATPPPLDQMINGGTRSPLATFPLANPGPIQMGGAATMALPTSPQGAQYAMIIIVLDSAAGAPGATDFVLLPLNTALLPAIQSIGISGGNVTMDFSSVDGQMYQLQSSAALGGAASWGNVGSPVMAVGADTIVQTPIGGAQNFYRLMLMP